MSDNTDYGKEFDELVKSYNGWVNSGSPKHQKKRGLGEIIKNIIKGMGLPITHFPERENFNQGYLEYKSKDPLYNKNINVAQKSAVSLASLYINTRYKILESEECNPEKEEQINKLTNSMYKEQKSIYIFEATNKQKI